MDKQILKTQLKHQAKSLAWRAITTVILTLTAVITVWVYAAFTEPLVGPNDSDQDFAQNILGNNDANNDFSSSNVTANADGSIIERQEYQQTQIGTYADATTTPAAAASVFAALKGLDSGYQEYTTGSGNWTCPAGVYSVNVLIVAGGGGGGAPSHGSGGGGGGGEIVLVQNYKVTPSATYAYVVGAGGAGGATGDNNGSSGSNSSFVSIVASGGIYGSKGSVKTGGKGGNTTLGGAGGAQDTAGSDGTLAGNAIVSRLGGGGGGGGDIYDPTPFNAGAGGTGLSAGGAGTGDGAACIVLEEAAVLV